MKKNVLTLAFRRMSATGAAASSVIPTLLRTSVFSVCMYRCEYKVSNQINEKITELFRRALARILNPSVPIMLQVRSRCLIVYVGKEKLKIKTVNRQLILTLVLV